MFYLLGCETVLRDVSTLLAGDSIPATVDELRSRLVDLAVKTGVSDLQPSDGQYCYEPGRIEGLVKHFQDDSVITDIETDFLATSDSSRKEAMSHVRKGHRLLRLQDPTLGSLFDLVIHTMFYHRSSQSSGGSVSSALGVIWCSPKRSWTNVDAAEFLLHEFTHNLIFLDERRHQYFTSFDDLADTNNWAVSAVLKKRRPLDKCLHSLIVANEILTHRSVVGQPADPKVHPPSIELHRSSLACLDSLKQACDNMRIVQPRLIELLDLVGTSLRHLSVPSTDLAVT